MKQSLEYAWHPQNPYRWDADKDGVIDGRQHHTLDMELFGPNSWPEGFYLGALNAAAEMADYLGEADARRNTAGCMQTAAVSAMKYFSMGNILSRRSILGIKPCWSAMGRMR